MCVFMGCPPEEMKSWIKANYRPVQPLGIFDYDSNRLVTGLKAANPPNYVYVVSPSDALMWGLPEEEMSLAYVRPENYEITDEYALGIADEAFSTDRVFVTQLGMDSGIRKLTLPKAKYVGRRIFDEALTLLELRLPGLTNPDMIEDEAFTGVYGRDWTICLESLSAEQVLAHKGRWGLVRGIYRCSDGDVQA